LAKPLLVLVYVLTLKKNIRLEMDYDVEMIPSRALSPTKKKPEIYSPRKGTVSEERPRRSMYK